MAKKIKNLAPSNGDHNAQPQPSHDEIAVCAYYLFEQQGKQPGHEIENWLQAERKLLQERKSEGDQKQTKILAT